MERSVLVDVAELVENPEGVALVRRVPSVMRLQGRDDCLRVWVDAPDLLCDFPSVR
jgi:hypothetical protein